MHLHLDQFGRLFEMQEHERIQTVLDLTCGHLMFNINFDVHDVFADVPVVRLCDDSHKSEEPPQETNDGHNRGLLGRN